MRLSILFGLLLMLPFSGIQSLDAQSQKQKLSWDDVLSPPFYSTGLAGSGLSINSIRWMNSGKQYSSLYAYNGVQRIVSVDIQTKEEQLIFSVDAHNWPGLSEPPRINSFSFSANEQYILLTTQEERIWRRSRKAHYYIFDRESKQLSRLFEGSVKQSLAEFSPDYTSIAFVAERNLYIKNMQTAEVRQITTDGAENSIINGATDWVYEEEFYLTKAWVWTADSQGIIYLKFDESDVPLFSMEEWGEGYSDFTRFKYPRAGEKNADVQLHAYDVKTKTHTHIELNEWDGWYVPRIYPSTVGNDFFITVTNRLQNELHVLKGSASANELNSVLYERSPYWLDMHTAFDLNDDASQFLWMSDKDGWNHLYMKEVDKDNWKQLTSGSWEVDQLLGFDQINKRVYFTAAKENSIERQFYSVHTQTLEVKALTKTAGWHQISLSADFKYFIDEWSANDQVPQYRLFNTQGEQLALLDNNEYQENKLAGYELPVKRFMSIANAEGDSLNSYMIYPSDFSEDKSYPVLMFVYGGPRSQMVQNRFSMGQRDLFHRYLADQGMIIACVDGRGTGAKGRDFKKQVYKQLGTLETEDQIAAAKYLASLPFIDGEHIGIWGWSYGGYMSSLSLAKAPDVFKAAAAVAPVSHWKWYDTIYTERFMQTPQLNAEGYERSAPTYWASNIQPHSYLLMHGSGDDNVHYQHTVAMANALIEQGTPFQMMMYPNRNHGIGDRNARIHLNTTLRDFFIKQLLQD